MKDQPTRILDMVSPAAAKELSDLFEPKELASVVGKYVEDVQERLDIVCKAINASDTDVIVRQAHSIKGSTAVFGFTDVMTTARELEEKGATQSCEKLLFFVNDIRSKLDVLQTIVQSELSEFNSISE